jgi:hypothetical protein
MNFVFWARLYLLITGMNSRLSIRRYVAKKTLYLLYRRRVVTYMPGCIRTVSMVL